MQCFMKKEDKRLIDVEHVETTGESAELTNTIVNSSWCKLMKHISPTFMYIIPMYLGLTTFTKTLPKCHFTYIFCNFLFRSGAPPPK